MQDLSYFAPHARRIDDRNIRLTNDVTLRVVSFYPEEEGRYSPVLMAPGLVSVMENFTGVVQALTDDFTVHFVETREKKSSKLPAGSKLNPESIGYDLGLVAEHLELEDDNYILFGASLSATSIIEGIESIQTKPQMVLLLEPNARFPVPWWSVPLLHLAPYLYGLIKPLGIWYIKHFRVNTEHDFEMYNMTIRALNSADPAKLKRIVLNLRKYQIWGRPETVDVPALVVGASKDLLHNHKDIERIAGEIPDSTYIDLDNHKRTHSAELVEKLKAFYEHRIE